MRSNASSTPYCSLCPRSAFGPLKMVVTPMRMGPAANAGLTTIANPIASNADTHLIHDSFADRFTSDRSQTTRGKPPLPERKTNVLLCAHVYHHLAEMPPAREILIGGRSLIEREDFVDSRMDFVD